MSRAKKIVDTMLDENYDEHVKAHKLVQKWDNAHDSYGKLLALKHKSMGLFREMGTAIAYERALARVGLKRDDVAKRIRGDAIGATHNYKIKMPVKVCTDEYCSWRGKPQPKNTEVCGSCGNPVKDEMVPTPPSVLRGRLASHMVGVETKDGRRVWFDQPIPPQPEMEAEAPKKPTAPIPASEFGAQGRLGKWCK